MLRPYRRLSRSSLHSRQTFHVKDPHQSRCARQLCLLHASRAFGAQAAPRRSFLCRAACGFQAAVHVYFVGLKNATRPTNCRTGEVARAKHPWTTAAETAQQVFGMLRPYRGLLRSSLHFRQTFLKKTLISLATLASFPLGKLIPPVQGATMIQSPK